MSAKVGLVLSGGGARGAYQAGVVRALADYGIQVHAISGASIGALNGAMVASSPDMRDASDRLHRVWTRLAEDSPLRPNWPVYIRLLAAVGQSFNVAGLVSTFVRTALAALVVKGLWDNPSAMDDSALLSDAPLRKVLDESIDFDRLQRIPLHVSVFKTRGAVLDGLGDIGGMLGVVDTPESEFKHIQSLPLATQKECLLASAALPVVFKPREVEGHFYSDGGQGGWSTVQGNTPLTPLLAEKCDVIFVSHLSDDSFWAKPRESGPMIVELRPRRSISRRGFSDLLGFDRTRVTSWMDQGYEDTMHKIAEVADAVGKHGLRTSAARELHASLDALDALMAESR